MRGSGSPYGALRPRPPAAALALALLACGAPAAAQEGPTAPGWAFGEPAGEVALAIGSAASLAAYFLPQRRSGWAAYAAHAPDETLDEISNFTGGIGGSVLLGGQGYLFEGGYLAGAGAKTPFARALHAPLIDAEAALLSTGLAMAIKRLAGRCRPWSTHGGRCAEGDEDHQAFPSGHTTPVAAIAGAHLALVLRTPGDASLRLGALGVAEAATLVTMALRIGAGAHSWEDVSAGFVLGHLTGAAVGLAHPMETIPVPGATGNGAADRLGAASAGTPVFSWVGRF